MIRLRHVVEFPVYHMTMEARTIRGDRIYGYDARTKEPKVYKVNSGSVIDALDADFEDCYSDRELWIMKAEQSERRYIDKDHWKKLDFVFPPVEEREIRTRGIRDGHPSLTQAAEWLLTEATVCRLDGKKLEQGFRSYGFTLPKGTLARHGAGYSFGTQSFENVIAWTQAAG